MKFTKQKIQTKSHAKVFPRMKVKGDSKNNSYTARLDNINQYRLEQVRKLQQTLIQEDKVKESECIRRLTGGVLEDKRVISI